MPKKEVSEEDIALEGQKLQSEATKIKEKLEVFNKKYKDYFDELQKRQSIVNGPFKIGDRVSITGGSRGILGDQGVLVDATVSVWWVKLDGTGKVVDKEVKNIEKVKEE